MLYIVLAYLMLLYLMLFVCIMLHFCNDFCNCFLFSCFVLVYWHIVCLFHVLICIMHSAFNLLVFPNSMFTPLLLFLFCFYWKGYVLSGKIALKNNHYYYMYIYFFVHALTWRFEVAYVKRFQKNNILNKKLVTIIKNQKILLKISIMQNT